MNEFGGIFNQKIEFQEHLNIISGENGTGKTTVLKKLKKQSGNKARAFSPKRNSQRLEFQQIISEFRQKNKTFDSFMNEVLGGAIDDTTFSNYPSFAECYYSYYDKKRSAGGTQKMYMKETTQEFNSVIGQVFPNFSIKSDWSVRNASPSITLQKNNSEIPLQSISNGEQEILSLIMNIHVVSDSVELILIDEPELHLNWSLEEKLFEFLDNFAQQYSKQFIVSTHSRIIFKERFIDKTQFLRWKNDKIICAKTVTEREQVTLAGEAIEIVKFGESFDNPVFVIEDRAHETILSQIAHELGKQIIPNRAGNSQNVVSLFRLSKTEGGWNNYYFVVDGDNQGNQFPGEPNFFHLDKYCIENYVLDIKTASKATRKTEDTIKTALLKVIQTKQNKITKSNLFFGKLISKLSKADIRMSVLDGLDASIVLPDFLREIGITRTTYINKYIKQCHRDGKLKRIFPKELIEAIAG